MNGVNAILLRIGRVSYCRSSLACAQKTSRFSFIWTGHFVNYLWVNCFIENTAFLVLVADSRVITGWATLGVHVLVIARDVLVAADI